jgi:hypothetical protein
MVTDAPAGSDTSLTSPWLGEPGAAACSPAAVVGATADPGAALRCIITIVPSTAAIATAATATQVMNWLAAGVGDRDGDGAR